MGMLESLRNSQLWNSIFRHGVPRDRRTRVMAIMSNVFLHLHPVAVRKSGIRLSFTWCMGGLTFFLFLAETVSGVLLMFYYHPTVQYAYQDIQDLRSHVTLGLLREIHRWGAHAMIIAIWLHMMRVFLTGSYKPPREFNWMVGFLLLVGTFVGENALLRFYVLHCVFIPVIATVLIAIHFWRIRKDGGISGPL